ncbi:MAG: 1,2-phenylacetyl-CoA epoxidase subunit PaaD [Actinomycetota bacterium]
MVTEAAVRDALSRVKDPEIPVCSITDLGLVERVTVTEGAIDVTLLPTFVGCPALDAIREDAERAVRDLAGNRDVRVTYVFDPPWTTDRVTEAGREAMKTFGIAPPGTARPLQIAVRCPHCGSTATTLESEFGPTPCRSIRYCTACRNPFEGFKPKQLEV